MAKLADALVSGTSRGNSVEVQVFLAANMEASLMEEIPFSPLLPNVLAVQRHGQDSW